MSSKAASAEAGKKKACPTAYSCLKLLQHIGKLGVQELTVYEHALNVSILVRASALL